MKSIQMSLLALSAAGATLSGQMLDVSNWVVTDTSAGGAGVSRSASGIVYTGSMNDGFAAGKLSGTATIAAPGESVSLSFKVSLAGIADQSNGFLFGLYNSAGTTPTADITGNNNGDFRDEYGFTVRLHTGTANGQNRLDVMNSAMAVTGANTLTTFNSAVALTTAQTQPGGIKAAATTYTITLNILGTVGGLDISGSIFDGTTTRALPNTDGSVTSYSGFGGSIAFDTVAFGLNNAVGTQTATISDLSVTAVPEPSTYAAILGLLALAGVARRQRR